LLEPEQIRELLNAKAAAILHAETVESFAEYAEFSRQYDRAIHSAWYMSTDSDGAQVFSYQLQDEIARGAFGLVYKAIAPDGNFVAVKLLHNEIRRNGDLLNAFRRGVRSMRILKSRGIPGMVDLLDAYEIPACVVMEWIDGPNLKEVGESRTLNDWDSFLEIVVQLTGIVLSAHQLPERVLHRDLRPANVMVKGYWDNDYQVHVLDFDLSWHQGSAERSVVHGSSMSGYLAPEQLEHRSGVSTQNALVDSFGLGMTMFFLMSLRNPLPGEHLHKNWEADVEAATWRLPHSSWRSLAPRVGRLILQATFDQQNKRWDMAQIYAELTRLSHANRHPEEVQSAELLAEEWAARSAMLKGYVWDENQLAATRDFGTGLVVKIQANESGRTVDFVLERHQTSADNRNRLGQNILRARDEVLAVFSGLQLNLKPIVGHGSLALSGSTDLEFARDNLSKLAKAMDSACEKMKFG
jgi:serine/threonine protein kinase